MGRGNGNVTARKRNGHHTKGTGDKGKTRGARQKNPHNLKGRYG